MAIITDNKILVGRSISGAPGFSLGRIKHYGIQPFARCVYNQAPTLQELYHAYYDKDTEGRFASTQYRGSVHAAKDAEWTSTFFEKRQPHKGEVVPCAHTPITIYNPISGPDRLFRDEKSGLWILECTQKTDFIMPPDGWVLKFCRSTGFPLITGTRKEAKKVFGESPPYFLAARNEMRAIRRSHERYVHQNIPFYIDGGYTPLCTNWSTGVRTILRAE